jgi:hypothetical protein
MEAETLFEAAQKQAEKRMTSAERVCKGGAGEAIEVLLLAAACLYRAKHKGGDCTDFARRARLAYDEVHGFRDVRPAAVSTIGT